MDKPSAALKGVACRIEFGQWVPFPREQVFVFFANPQNLPRIMPGKTDTRIEKLSFVAAGVDPGWKLCPGARPDWSRLGNRSFVPGGASSSLRRTWSARITEFEWNHHFCDVQLKGPLGQLAASA